MENMLKVLIFLRFLFNVKNPSDWHGINMLVLFYVKNEFVLYSTICKGK